MLAVYAKCVVSDHNIPKFMDVATELIKETRKENGNVSYELIRGSENKNIYAFLEKWSDKAALDQHMATAHFTCAIPKLKALVAGDIEISVHDIII